MDDATELYGAYARLLLNIATRKYKVPFADAEDLMQEVFLTYLRNNAVIAARAYLVGGIVYACRNYWRRSERAEHVEIATLELAAPPAPLLDRLQLREALLRVGGRDRLILQLRYRGYTVAEIAKSLGLTRSRTEKLLRRAKKRAAGKPEDGDSTHRRLACLRSPAKVTYLPLEYRQARPCLHRRWTTTSSSRRSGSCSMTMWRRGST